MRNKQTNYFGWKNFSGAITGIVQMTVGIAILSVHPIIGSALIGSGTASLIYSVSTRNENMTLLGYSCSALVGGGLGALAGYIALPPAPTHKPIMGEVVTVTTLQYVVPMSSGVAPLVGKLFCSTPSNPIPNPAPPIAAPQPAT